MTLLSGGAITLHAHSTITLTTNVVFQPVCTDGKIALYNGTDPTVLDNVAPFYSSSVPLVFVIGATTVTAWALIIVLLITPAGITNRASGSLFAFFPTRRMPGQPLSRARPLLQRVAALLVAVAMTIATVDTFRAAENQYSQKTVDASVLRDDVAGSIEIRVIRVISDIFLWLAQVQTLIRLFPRHKEKLIIKWLGFLLILLDLIFSCLNSFFVNSLERPRAYQDAIPALAYLFQLSLSLLYAAWVFFYSLTKRRYAFFHPKMPNISIIATLSAISVLVPVVFFIVDVAEPDVAGWGDYFRWVGAAAASIIVWEWVDRIELLEQDEKKDGILGREVFDGDEMLGTTPTTEITLHPGADRRHSASSRTDSQSDNDRKFSYAAWMRSKLYGMISRGAKSRDAEAHANMRNASVFSFTPAAKTAKPDDTERNDVLNRGQAILSDETTPAGSIAEDGTDESTLYVVRYLPVTSTPPLPRARHTNGVQGAAHQEPDLQGQHLTGLNTNAKQSTDSRQPAAVVGLRQYSRPLRTFAINTFRKSRASPPLEVKRAMSTIDSAQAATARQTRRWTDVRHRLDTFTADRHARTRKRQEDAIALEPTVIPAPPRGQTWSPDIMRHSPAPRPCHNPIDEVAPEHHIPPGITSPRYIVLGLEDSPLRGVTPALHARTSGE